MFVRSMHSLTLARLFVGATWAADDPFVGKWKVNPDKSKITGNQSRVESLGGNRYRYTNGEYSTTVVADGRLPTEERCRLNKSMQIRGDSHTKERVRRELHILGPFRMVARNLE
jgi:hypothetical protein